MTIQHHSAGSFDASQFKLQPDGTFRISIRGMAAMAGIDDSSLSRSLKSAAAENALPCARSLLAQGFNPAAVSTWGETGGIPESAAPFILEHYGITATNPSAQARAVLLAFSRVGINAYLKERLGFSTGTSTTLPQTDVLTVVERSLGLMERLGGLDARDEFIFKDIIRNHAARCSGGALLPQIRMLSLQEAFQELGGATPSQATKLACTYGKPMKRLYIEENNRAPKTHKQLVNGRTCDVCDYEFTWLEQHADELRQAVLSLSSAH